MSALFKSVDETLTEIRAQHEAEMKECKDKTLAAQIEATLLRDQLAKAVEARAAAERLASKLITQFGVVEHVFAEAKALALSAYVEPKPEPAADHPLLPEVKP